jgi:hypothetical protein
MDVEKPSTTYPASKHSHCPIDHHKSHYQKNHLGERHRKTLRVRIVQVGWAEAYLPMKFATSKTNTATRPTTNSNRSQTSRFFQCMSNLRSWPLV